MDFHRQNANIEEPTQNAPLSSMSRDAGVSSSCIRAPSYKNLFKIATKKKSAVLSFPGSHMRSVTRAKNANQWAQKSSYNSPNAANILAHLAGISTLKLAQPGAPLDLEENLFSRRADNLNPASTLTSRPSSAKNCEFKGIKRQRQYLDINRRVGILQLGLGGVLGVLLLLLLVVRHCQFQARVG